MKRRTKIFIVFCCIISMVQATTVFAFAQVENDATAQRSLGNYARGGASGGNAKGITCPNPQDCKNDGVCINGENCKNDGVCTGENCKNDGNNGNRGSDENRGNSNNNDNQRGNGACRNNG